MNTAISLRKLLSSSVHESSSSRPLLRTSCCSAARRTARNTGFVDTYPRGLRLGIYSLPQFMQ